MRFWISCAKGTCHAEAVGRFAGLFDIPAGRQRCRVLADGYARIVDDWIKEIGLDLAQYGTHSMRRTKATLIYRRTKNLRAVQLLLDHAKMESAVRYLGIEVEDALEMAEQTDI